MGMKSVGAYLKTLREQKGLSQKHIALELMVSEKQVSRWENGLSDPASSMLIYLTKLLDGDFDDISYLLLLEPDLVDSGEKRAKNRLGTLKDTNQSTERYTIQAIEHAIILRSDLPRLEKLVNYGKKLMVEG